MMWYVLWYKVMRPLQGWLICMLNWITEKHVLHTHRPTHVYIYLFIYTKHTHTNLLFYPIQSMLQHAPSLSCSFYLCLLLALAGQGKTSIRKPSYVLFVSHPLHAGPGKTLHSHITLLPSLSTASDCPGTVYTWLMLLKPQTPVLFLLWIGFAGVSRCDS